MKNENVAINWYIGKSASAGHLYTDGTTIWSYGPHFPLATKKKGVYYVNSDKYSQTTSCHRGRVVGVLAKHNERFFDATTEELQEMIK